MIQDIFIKTNYIKSDLHMICHRGILKIYLGKQNDKKLHDKVFSVAKNAKCVRYHRGLASVVYKSFDKKFFSGAGISQIILNQW